LPDPAVFISFYEVELFLDSSDIFSTNYGFN